MIKLTHLLVLLSAAAAVAVSAASASSTDSASLVNSNNLRRAGLHQSTGGVRRSVQEETEEATETDSKTEGAETDGGGGNNNQNENRQRNRNRNKNTGEDETTLVYKEYATAPNVFKAQTDVTILFASFSTSSTAEYGFACIFVAVLAFSLETLIACQRDDWIGLEKDRAKSYVCSAIILTIFRMLTATIGILLILVVSSFNVGIFIATILGSGIAYLIFTLRRLKKESKKATKRSNSGRSDASTDRGSNVAGASATVPMVPVVKDSNNNLSIIPEDGFTDNGEEGTHRTHPTHPGTVGSHSQRSGSHRSRSSKRSQRSRGSAGQRSYGSGSRESSRGGSSVPKSISLSSVAEESNLETPVESDRRRLRLMRARPAPVPVATAVVATPPEPVAPIKDDYLLQARSGSSDEEEIVFTADSFDEEEGVSGVLSVFTAEERSIEHARRRERIRSLRQAASLDITIGEDATVCSERSEM